MLDPLEDRVDSLECKLLVYKYLCFILSGVIGGLVVYIVEVV